MTLTFVLTKERRFVAVTDPLPAGFEAVESWFDTTAHRWRKPGPPVIAARRRRGAEWQSGGSSAVSITSSVTTTGFSCSPRGSARVARVQLHRSRDDGRNVPHCSGAGGGDVQPEIFGRTDEDRRSRSRR